jgi:hypothetical protein
MCTPNVAPKNKTQPPMMSNLVNVDFDTKYQEHLSGIMAAVAVAAVSCTLDVYPVSYGGATFGPCSNAL